MVCDGMMKRCVVLHGCCYHQCWLERSYSTGVHVIATVSRLLSGSQTNPNAANGDLATVRVKRL